MNYDNIKVNTQSSIRIEGSKVVYFDPFQIGPEPHDADLICITHDHYDHFDPASIFKKNRQGFSVIQLPTGIAPFYLLTRTNVCKHVFGVIY